MDLIMDHREYFTFVLIPSHQWSTKDKHKDILTRILRTRTEFSSNEKALAWAQGGTPKCLPNIQYHERKIKREGKRT